jgi:hemerythrin-like domain-containing protein
MIQGNIKNFAKDLTAWVDMYVQHKHTFVTEQGVIEDWKGNDKAQNDKVLTNLKEYLNILNEHLD